MKATAIAPSNIAFIKYWGKKDDELRLPTNGSISMNLSGLTTTTTVEFSLDYKKDLIEIDGNKNKKEIDRVIKHLDRIRNIAGIDKKAKVVSKNNFPSGTGLSASASGFAALTVAAVSAADLKLTEKELSILARFGSGSACRSIPDGFVEWLDGDTSDESCAVSLHEANWWDIVDVVAIVNLGKKDVPTTKGMEIAGSSPFFQARLSSIDNKIKIAKKVLEKKDFTRFGKLLESEALEMHAIAITSSPSLIYWTSGTLGVMKQVKMWRKAGFESYFTINTGQDIHIICQKHDAIKISNLLKNQKDVRDVIINMPSNGARLVNNHLF
ncbi:diphosphomevalonate decarboxylase [Patescibacteria group bacterium]